MRRSAAARSFAHSVPRSLTQSLARSLSSLLAHSVPCSLTQSLARALSFSKSREILKEAAVYEEAKKKRTQQQLQVYMAAELWFLKLRLNHCGKRKYLEVEE